LFKHYLNLILIFKHRNGCFDNVKVAYLSALCNKQKLIDGLSSMKRNYSLMRDGWHVLATIWNNESWLPTNPDLGQSVGNGNSHQLRTSFGRHSLLVIFLRTFVRLLTN